jgi:AcrR family transcriptional regulator
MAFAFEIAHGGNREDEMMDTSSRRGRGRPSAETQREIEVAILDAAVRLFNAVPPAEVSMEGIALEAGVTKAALYRRFSNRSELLSAALEPEVLERLNQIRVICEDEPDPIAALRAMFFYMFDDVVDGRSFDLRRLLVAIAPHDLPLRDDLRRWRAQFSEPVEKCLRSAIDVGRVHSADPSLLAAILFDVLIEGPANVRTMFDYTKSDSRSLGVSEFESRWSIIMNGLLV